jgi:hypothetical protein
MESFGHFLEIWLRRLLQDADPWFPGANSLPDLEVPGRFTMRSRNLGLPVVLPSRCQMR